MIIIMLSYSNNHSLSIVARGPADCSQHIEIGFYIAITISITIICAQHNTFMLWQPLPCSPAAETAPQPLIWCSET